MIKRTLYFGNPAYLKNQQAQLKVIRPSDQMELASIPIEDIGIVLLDNPRVTLTHAVVDALLQNNCAIISCDAKHLPSGLMLPLEGNTLLSERMRFQLNAKEPLRKNLWGQTITAKVKNQIAVLKRLGRETKQLEALVPQVLSGDPENIEGRAAKLYWGLLFDEFRFLRQRYGEMPNAHLNYGYAILRAITARSLVGSGLLPTLGIFHRNKYNAYCLADDIMEPLRPYCDLLVYEMLKGGEIEDDGITKVNKQRLLSLASIDMVLNKKKSPLLVGTSRITNSLFECYEGSRRKILYPTL